MTAAFQQHIIVHSDSSLTIALIINIKKHSLDVKDTIYYIYIIKHKVQSSSPCVRECQLFKHAVHAANLK